METMIRCPSYCGLNDGGLCQVGDVVDVAVDSSCVISLHDDVPVAINDAHLVQAVNHHL